MRILGRWMYAHPNATTRPPLSFTADFLQPGQSLFSMGTSSAINVVQLNGPPSHPPIGPYAQPQMVRARLPRVYKQGPHSFQFFPISCARACTVASEVFTEAQSFADCKLHIRTRLLASAFSNFWKKYSSSAMIFY